MLSPATRCLRHVVWMSSLLFDHKIKCCTRRNFGDNLIDYTNIISGTDNYCILIILNKHTERVLNTNIRFEVSKN